MREETCFCHMGYSFQLTARVLLYAPSHRQDNTYHSICVTPVVEHWMERVIARWVHHEGSIRRPIAPWANALTTELHAHSTCYGSRALVTFCSGGKLLYYIIDQLIWAMLHYGHSFICITRINRWEIRLLHCVMQGFHRYHSHCTPLYIS